MVGFAGEGGTEFVDPRWSTVIHDSDVLGLADGLAEAARAYDEDRATWQERVDGGRGVVLERYNRAAMRSALDKAFGEIMAPGSAALVTVPATVPHYQTHAPAPCWRHEGYRWARRTARRTFDAVRERYVDPESSADPHG